MVIRFEREADPDPLVHPFLAIAWLLGIPAVIIRVRIYDLNGSLIKQFGSAGSGQEIQPTLNIA